MIEERMKSAMQDKLPDVPEGFDARSDMQLLELTAPVKEKRMKLSIGWVTALVLVCVLVTGAVAATLNLFGLGDFLSRHAEKTGATITEEFMEKVQKEDISAETERVKYTVQESYYDGRFLRVIMTIQPRDNVLLLENYDYTADDDIWSVYNQIEPGTMTIAEYAEKNHNGRAARIRAEVNLWPDAAKEGDEPGAKSELRLNEDGSVTAYYQWEVWNYINEREERDILLRMSYIPGIVSGKTNRIDLDTPKTELTEIPLKIRFAGNEQYVCDRELAFPEAGMKIRRIVMTVTPLDISCNLYYKITDADRWNAAQADDTYLAFQLVAPDSTEPDGWKAYPDGFTGYAYTTGTDTNEFRTTFSVSREALSDHYVLRAANEFLKQSFGTVEFDVKPQEDDVLFTPHEPAEWLYEYPPEKPSRLTEENRSCEKDGIRLELVSSSVKDGMMNVVFSLEDTEGNRINENTEADIRLDGEHVETRYDAEQKKMSLTWSTEVEYAEPENQNYELEISLLRNYRDIQVDLLPLLEEYGNRAKLIHVREEDFGGDRPGLKSELVLDYTESLDIPLSENVMLSGIGMEDGELRVQFHYPKHHKEVVQVFKEADKRRDEWEQGPYTTYIYPPYDCNAYLYEAGEHEEGKRLAEDIYGPMGIGWGSLDGNEEAEIRDFGDSLKLYEWKEFRFEVGSGLTETQKLTAEIREEDPPVIGVWDIHVPAGLVNPAK